MNKYAERNTVSVTLALRCMIILILALLAIVIASVEIINNKNARIEEMAKQIQVLEQRLEQASEQNPEPTLPIEPQQVPKSTEKQTNMEYVGEFKCTAYCTEKYEHICGSGHGITASGEPVQAGVTVAVGDTDRFPYGTVLYIEGVGTRIVQDTGGGLTDNQIDLALDTHEEALDWGYQDNLKVYVIKDGGVE